MQKLLFFSVVFSLSLGVAIGCATDEPRYASPPPGSHSPFAEPDERGTDDPLRDEPEDGPEPAEEDEEEDVPLPEVH